jgi:hypothetical protein
MTLGDEEPLGSRATGNNLPDPRSFIEGTDWAGLEHAYGPAQDTPFHLLELLHEDPEVQAQALGLLDMSVLHQGSLCSATAPAAQFIASILDDPRTLARHESYFPWDDRSRPLRAALLEWLGQVADAAAHGEADHADGPDDPGVTAEVRRVRMMIYEAVSVHLQGPDPDVREAALEATSALFEAPELAERIIEATQLLRRVIADSTDRRERAVIAVTIGAWAQDTRDLLNDSDPAVRASAALADACAEDPRATREIIRALCEPATVDAWFSDPLPYIAGPFRATLLSAAIGRTTFEELLPAALASIPWSSNLTAAHDWGPLLAAAFPLGYSEGTQLTESQHRYLSALADRDEVWRFSHLTASWLQDVGLPTDRGTVQALLGHAHREPPFPAPDVPLPTSV